MIDLELQAWFVDDNGKQIYRMKEGRKWCRIQDDIIVVAGPDIIPFEIHPDGTIHKVEVSE